MDRLISCIERAALRSGFEVEEARSAGLQMLAAPVLQTGPHCLLLIEPDAFYTHIFSLLGLNAHSREWHIAYHASTVSFSEKAKKGPGWLWLEDEPLNVFGLPRSRMDSFSLCGLDGPFSFALSNANGEVAPNDSAARLLGELPADRFSSANEAIGIANQTLWRRKLPSPLKLLQLDDFDICDLVADHLEDEASWMSACFIGDGRIAQNILNAIDRLNDGPWRGWIRRTTDLFWGLERSRIVPLRLSDGALRARGPSKLEVRFRPDRIASALRQRAILPSLYTVFLVSSILPGVRVLGGCRQFVYYPLMRHLTAAGLQQSDHRSLLETLREDRQPGLWGHRVLKPDGGYPFQEMEQSGQIATSLSKYAEIPLTQSSGDLASFTRDPIWAELSEHLAAGTITAQSDAWQWSGC
ncbi:hypothetical protein MRS76_23820 [Rhizobiaceae bacterium n13]|uniref:hypothetical protein n=1 Tax=Ferirhizobium litorale TaxID=2927786 RepID=UPI0024B2D671|nr:hypothetical protein [Fererhizobium litorale]MDI7864958.1 hypothetical protein [Fererhizobium litorale]